MSPTIPITVTMNIMLMIVGISLVFQQWNTSKVCAAISIKNKPRPVLYLAWLLIGLSYCGWVVLFNIEFGMTYHFVVMPLIAWLIIFYQRQRVEIKNNKKHAKNSTRPYQKLNLNTQLNAALVNKMLILKKTITLLLAGPIALIASVYFSLLLTVVMPVNYANSLVATAFMFPLVWALLCFWICATEKRLFPLIIISVSGTLSAIVIFN